jgi:hypothetical protein
MTNLRRLVCSLVVPVDKAIEREGGLLLVALGTHPHICMLGMRA